MFIGGIQQVIGGFDVTPTNSSDVAWGIARIVFAGLVGWISFMICFFLSALCWDAGRKY